MKLLQLRAKAQGLAIGMIAALSVFVATNFLVIKGGENVGRHLSLLNQYFWGYSVTFVGSLIGAVYAFVIGFLLGYVMASTYNLFAADKSSS